MKSIQGVSLPRSGHNLLVKHLQSYFGSRDMCRGPRGPRLSLPFLPRAARSVTSSLPSSRNRFHYCEYYYSCRCRPCRDPNNRFQKSHDFKLGLPVESGRKYIVQIRDAAGMMISWFELRLSKGREKDTVDGFRDFMRRQFDYRNGFVQKWVQQDIDQRLILDYDDYLCRPAEQFSQVVMFFDPEHRIDQQAVRSIVKDVRPARIVNQFRYYEALLDEVGI